jgi:hypothetical protein
MRQLFIDLDGVLADFDGFYETSFGIKPDRDAPEPPNFWQHIDGHGRFFRDMPPMPDALDLWRGANELHREPIILTGLPLMASAEPQKREWVAEHIGSEARVICCRSKDKRNHARSGDVLVDDWKKYRHLWEEMGGVFVLHTSAATTLAALEPFFATEHCTICQMALPAPLVTFDIGPRGGTAAYCAACRRQPGLSGEVNRAAVIARRKALSASRSPRLPSVGRGTSVDDGPTPPAPQIQKGIA